MISEILVCNRVDLAILQIQNERKFQTYMYLYMFIHQPCMKTGEIRLLSLAPGYISAFLSINGVRNCSDGNSHDFAGLFTTLSPNTSYMYNVVISRCVLFLYFHPVLKPGVGNRPVVTYAYLSQVDRVA